LVPIDFAAQRGVWKSSGNEFINIVFLSITFESTSSSFRVKPLLKGEFETKTNQ
jgi:hypothetical protein